VLLKFDMHVPDWLPHALQGGAGLGFGVSGEGPFLGDFKHFQTLQDNMLNLSIYLNLCGKL